MNKTRCPWVGKGKDFYDHYHDTEWGVPVHDDRLHFEMLILEGAQAGLSWETVLKKREGYRKAFRNFDPAKCARLTDAQLETQMQNPDIIRNRLKIYSVRKNALAFLAIRKEFGSFDAYVWDFFGGKTKVTKAKTMDQIGTTSMESDALSKDLKKRGMTFVGSTIIQSYLQATGFFNDHLTGCFRHKQLK
ncbi:MAG: DNA-3-methyladenine glycosylase [Micavibrio sp.]|nr:DNA-3-methyladenine glycosylase [Micavibrio sp.]